MSSNEEHRSDFCQQQLAVLDWRPAEDAETRPQTWRSQAPVPSEESWPHLSAATAAQSPRCPLHQTGRTRRAAAPTSAHTVTPTSSFLEVSTLCRKSRPPGGGRRPHFSPGRKRAPLTQCSAGFRVPRGGLAEKHVGGASQIGQRRVGRVGLPSHYRAALAIFLPCFSAGTLESAASGTSARA